MAETVVKTVENVDRLFSQIVVNGEVHESENYVTPTPSQSTPQTQPAVTPEPESSSEPASTQGEDIYGVDLNDVLHNFVDNSVPDKIQQAVQSLDVPSSGGSGKYIKSISQTDGKIETTEGDITDSVTSDSSDPVTSGAVADVLSALPTDAVLHYSFDDIPDYPDGTAIEKYIKDFTSVPTNWSSVTYGVLSVSNGELINTVTNGTTGWIRRYYSSTANAVIKIKIKATKECAITISYYSATSSQYEVITALENAQAGQDYVLIGYIPRIDYVLIKAVTSTATDFQLILSEYYVGNGSYSTPVIDNANGQNNATNNGGLAVKGVSGKGVGIYAGNNGAIKVNNWDSSNWDRPYTISAWIKTKEGASSYIVGWADNYAVQNHYFRYNTANKNIWFDVNEGTRFIGYICNVDLNDGKFHHIVGINKFESGKAEIWVDGIKQSLTTQVRNPTNVENSFMIGNSKINNSYYQMNGQQFDDFQLFDRALSEAEVKALYLNRGNTPKYYSWADWKISQLA